MLSSGVYWHSDHWNPSTMLRNFSQSSNSHDLYRTLHILSVDWSDIDRLIHPSIDMTESGSGSGSGSSSGSPCGACKFLRRKCIRGCVFAPYFCHEQGAAHFAAIHKVFGASNVSKLLTHLPVCDRSEAAITISYEAQARLQDPIYGCVSHIFALQHQVICCSVMITRLKLYDLNTSHGEFLEF